VFDSVHILRARLAFSWQQRSSRLNTYMESLATGVRDFSTFIEVCEVVDEISKEFLRAERFFSIRPLRRRYLRVLMSELERIMQNDSYWLDMPKLGKDSISEAARLSLLISRTEMFLENKFELLPLELSEWV
jgi:hypothetical protein